MCQNDLDQFLDNCNVYRIKLEKEAENWLTTTGVGIMLRPFRRQLKAKKMT